MIVLARFEVTQSVAGGGGRVALLQLMYNVKPGECCISPPPLLTLWPYLRRPTAEDAYNWLQDLVSESGEEEVSLLLASAWLPLVSYSLIVDCLLLVQCLLLFYGVRIVYCLSGLFVYCVFRSCRTIPCCVFLVKTRKNPSPNRAVQLLTSIFFSRSCFKWG